MQAREVTGLRKVRWQALSARIVLKGVVSIPTLSVGVSGPSLPLFLARPRVRIPSDGVLLAFINFAWRGSCIYGTKRVWPVVRAHARANA
jgi:hypothetical protein